MKPSLLNLVPLAIAGTLLAGPVLGADLASKPVKPAAQERSSAAGAPKLKPAASSEFARREVKAEAPDKTRQLEVPVTVVLAAD